MKTKQIILSTLLSFTFLVGCAYSKSFSFTPKEPQWSFYGEGLGSYVSHMGRGTDQTSMWLSTDYGERETAFFTWNDLTPGLYKVSTYVRAEDVQKGPEGASFWHFYDGGQGTESPFTDLYGSYDWRKVEYLVHVKASDLTIWFRLKSAGQVWIDDFTIEKVEAGQEKISIEPATPILTKFDKTRQINLKTALKKKLYSFDSSEPGHPFSLKNNTGLFTPQKFFNFKIFFMEIFYLFFLKNCKSATSNVGGASSPTLRLRLAALARPALRAGPRERGEPPSAKDFNLGYTCMLL